MDTLDRYGPSFRSSTQTTDTWHATKGSVKGDDFLDPSLEGYFRNQMVRETCRAIPGCFQCLSGQAWRFDGDASRSKQSVQGMENSLLFPSASENPREFCKNDKGDEDPIPRSGLRESGPRFPGLSPVIVEQGARPDIGVSREHHPCLRAFASFISSKDIA